MKWEGLAGPAPLPSNPKECLPGGGNGGPRLPCSDQAWEVGEFKANGQGSPGGQGGSLLAGGGSRHGPHCVASPRSGWAGGGAAAVTLGPWCGPAPHRG